MNTPSTSTSGSSARGSSDRSRGRDSRRHRPKIAWHVMTPDKAFWTFAAFVVLVFLMGGGSRYDIDSVGPLRAMSAIFLGIGVYCQTGQSFRLVARPVALILLLGLWMAVQLLPLPPSWWTSLHGRENIAQAGELVGLAEVWRPITFSPMRTFNSLASLVVPLAAFMLLSLLDDNGWRRMRSLIIAIGVVSALLGIAQITLRGSPGLYLYEITNSDNAVGLFSNRNHNALFLNIALLFSIFRARGSKSRLAPADLFMAAGQMVLLVGVLITGSRFGFALLAVVASVFAAGAMLVTRGDSRTPRTRRRLSEKIAGISAGVAAIALIAFFAAMERIPALGRLFEVGVAQDLRARSFSDVLDLAIGHFPFGVGFGAFEQAYRTIERDELLSPTYFNQAHNDWLQIVVEGGLPAVIILALGVFLILKRGWWTWRSRAAMAGKLGPATLGFLTLLVIGMHSLVDYPLRVPSLMVVAAIALGLIFQHHTRMVQV